MATMNMLLVSPTPAMTSGYCERRTRSTSRSQPALSTSLPHILGAACRHRSSRKPKSDTLKAGGHCSAMRIVMASSTISDASDDARGEKKNNRANEKRMRPLVPQPLSQSDSMSRIKEATSSDEERSISGSGRNGNHLSQSLVQTATTPMRDNMHYQRGKPVERPFAAFAASSVIYYACIAALLLAAAPRASAERPDSQLCPLNEYIDDSDQTVQEFFECPGLEDPPDYKVCCDEKCCPLVEIDSVLRVDIRIAMIISLTVICACVALGVALVLCCFISSCPLYDVCMGGWSWRDSDRPPKDFPASFMGSGYVPSDMHPLTLNGSATSGSSGNGKISEKSHKIAPGVSPNDADHV